jgi:hypothetical protein
MCNITFECDSAPTEAPVGASFVIKMKTNFEPQPGQEVRCLRVPGRSRTHHEASITGDKEAHLVDGVFIFTLTFTSKGVPADGPVGYHIPFALEVDGKEKDYRQVDDIASDAI